MPMRMSISMRMTLCFFAGLLLLTGCDPAQKSPRSSPARVARGGPTTNVQNGNNTGNPTGFNQGGNYTSGNSSSQWAYIQGNDPNSFYRTVQGLVSASMNPEELGNVNSNSDVAIIGFIDMDQNGNVYPANSRLRIEIWDDYARSGSASEIALAFNSMASSNYSGNQIQFHFQDEFGRITVTGQVSQNNFYGTVSYQNAKVFDGSSNYASGTLGTFQVPACGFFRCQ